MACAMLPRMAPFTFFGYCNPHDGYGYSFMKTADALRHMALGRPLANILPVETPTDRPTPKRRVDGTAVALLPPPWFSRITADNFIGYTMFESTRLPADYVRVINKRARTVIVPAGWNRAVFRESGVTVPLYVVPLGVDAQDYFPLERPERPYTFAWSGTPDMRKGWDVAYRAFRLAFGDRQDVLLRLHFRKLPQAGLTIRDANVQVVHGLLGLPAMRDFYQQADCFLFPSRGEGYGLPPREAAATGLPVIATNYGGLADEIDMWGTPLAVRCMKPADFGVWPVGTVGDWAEPDVDHLVALLREAASNREAWAARGAQAADWLCRQATWSRTARGVLAIASLAPEVQHAC